MGNDRIDCDVVIVGGGPAGLGAAIRLRQLAKAAGVERSVCLLEKGARIGAHLLSGAVMDPVALTELFPDWRHRLTPPGFPVTRDSLRLLTRHHALRLPIPARMSNAGQVIISLGELCRWLANEAESLGVAIFPGFAGALPLYRPDGSLGGVVTGPMGLDRSGSPTAVSQPGVAIHARQTILAEGCLGSLTRTVLARCDDPRPQIFGLGIKELWEVAPGLHRGGEVTHAVGWPLPGRLAGGSFWYQFGEHRVAVGLVVGLGDGHPWLSPFGELQRLKTHPALRTLLSGGRRLAYGARTLVEGGVRSLPRVTFPGGMLVGDAAGLLNAARLKGIHTALKSGLVAAAAIHDHLQSGESSREVVAYASGLRESWLWRELVQADTVRGGLQWGGWSGLGWAALKSWGWRGRLPSPRKSDEVRPGWLNHERYRPIAYPDPDGVVTFDRVSSLALAHLTHREDQPDHVRFQEATGSVGVDREQYEAMATRYCPGGVFAVSTGGAGQNRVRVTAANCLHCRSCEVWDAMRHITWTLPEGGSGPDYAVM